ncbi:MAG: hypothetical protein GY697_19435, partial [Desulfobacterales bacterium]|nr:hypothetical protein [Desulfobacterales bacterium]
VLIGGDYQGKNPQIVNAKRTFVGKDASIEADALDEGDGGKVIVWADEITGYYGDIIARGGLNGGDGGFIEVSGKETLDFKGTADASAPNGDTGTLLLDPGTLTIIDTDGTTPADQDANLISDDEILFGDGDIGGNQVSWGAIDGLAATANIVLEATGLITVNDVTGVAGGSITSNNLVQLDLTTGSLRITSTGGSILFSDTNDVIRTEGGAITFQAQGGDITAGGFNTTGAGGAQTGAITIEASGNILLSALADGISAGSGTVTLDAGSNITTNSNATAEIKTMGDVILTADAIGAANSLDVDGAAALTINDSGSGNIFIDELTANTITSTTITVADATSGDIDIDYSDTDIVSINEGHIFNATTLDHAFTYTASAGSITDSGVLTLGGTSSFTTTEADQTITLDQVSLFTGAVSLATTGASGDISITNVGQTLDLGTVTTVSGGGLVVETNAGSITDSGVITARGTSSFTTTTVDDDITLNSLSAYTGAVSLSVNGASGNAEISNAQAALNLGTITTTAGGGLIIETDSGGIT